MVGFANHKKNTESLSEFGVGGNLLFCKEFPAEKIISHACGEYTLALDHTAIAVDFVHRDVAGRRELLNQGPIRSGYSAVRAEMTAFLFGL